MEKGFDGGGEPLGVAPEEGLGIGQFQVVNDGAGHVGGEFFAAVVADDGNAGAGGGEVGGVVAVVGDEADFGRESFVQAEFPQQAVGAVVGGQGQIPQFGYGYGVFGVKVKVVVMGVDRIEKFLFDFFVGKIRQFRHGGVGITKVNGPFFYPFDLLPGGQFPHMDVDFRVGLGKGFQEVVHEGDGHIEGYAEAECAFYGLVVSGHFQIEGIFDFTNFFGPGEKVHPRIRQSQGAAAPGRIHQFDPVMGFEGTYLGGECGLGQ